MERYDGMSEEEYEGTLGGFNPRFADDDDVDEADDDDDDADGWDDDADY